MGGEHDKILRCKAAVQQVSGVGSGRKERRCQDRWRESRRQVFEDRNLFHLTGIEGFFVSLGGRVLGYLDRAPNELLYRSEFRGKSVFLSGREANKGRRNARRVHRFRWDIEEGGCRFLQLQGVQRVIEISRFFVHGQQRRKSPHVNKPGVCIHEFQGRVSPETREVGNGFPGAFGVWADVAQLSVFGGMFRHRLDKVVHGRALQHKWLYNVVFLWIGGLFGSLYSQHVHDKIRGCIECHPLLLLLLLWLSCTARSTSRARLSRLYARRLLNRTYPTRANAIQKQAISRPPTTVMVLRFAFAWLASMAVLTLTGSLSMSRPSSPAP
mmetsp:Transcript_27009/g.59537  ORF Transcript_27009/g.59537 Transcript_27009/m.59537 type:complete len:326 (+) Transcript_27009:977-1954(+)